MKKYLKKPSFIAATLTLALGFNASYALNGLWIAAELDAPVNSLEINQYKGDTKDSGKSELNTKLNYGAKLGYIIGFTERQAVRPYAHVSAGYQRINFGRDVYSVIAGGGIDYVLSFSTQNPWGLFVGFGYEAILGNLRDEINSLKTNLGDDAKIQNHGAFANFGFSKMFGSVVRLEFGIKVPFYAYLDWTKASQINTNEKEKGNVGLLVQGFLNLGFVF